MNRIGMFVDISHVAHATMHAVLDTTSAPVLFSHTSANALCPIERNVPDSVLRRLNETDGVVMVNFYSKFVECDESKRATLSDVADHIEHIASIAGRDKVGLGSDFNGIDLTPVGLEDVSKYPYLIAELLKRGWSDEDVKGVAGANLLRIWRGVELARDKLSDVLPDESELNGDSVQYAIDF
jgi:membrane dipeptidase